MHWNVRINGGIMNKEEYEMRMYEIQMEDEYKNRKQRQDSKDLFVKLKPKLNEMKVDHFENPKMLKKVYQLEEIIKVGEKINKIFDQLDN